MLIQEIIVMKASVVSLVATLPMLVVFAAGAQQLKQPSAAPSQNAGSTLPQSADAQRGGVASDPAQRSQSPKINSAGPAVDAKRPVLNPPPAAPASPRVVTDAQGKMISGAVPMGANQVMDPKTGKVYPTMPQGDGRRVIAPTPKP